MKKIIKLGGILGGIVIFGEIFGIMGEVQMALTFSNSHPDVINEITEYRLNNDTIKDLSKYKQIKCKIIRELIKIGMENKNLS